jgi:hypothetical protein
MTMNDENANLQRLKNLEWFVGIGSASLLVSRCYRMPTYLMSRTWPATPRQIRLLTCTKSENHYDRDNGALL